MSTVMVFAAHSDDEVIGVGGTIAKFAEEGKKVVVVIFTSGEMSSPWLKKEAIISDRENESERIARFIGADTVLNLGFKDGNLKNLIGESEIQNMIKDLMVKYGPDTIFVHSKYDRHPSGDHKAVNSIVLNELERFDPQKKISTFIYEIWNISNEVSPRYYVDISKTFYKKIKAMKMFKSQWLFVNLLLIPVYIRAKIAGLHSGNKYAERFYKIR